MIQLKNESKVTMTPCSLVIQSEPNDQKEVNNELK